MRDKPSTREYLLVVEQAKLRLKKALAHILQASIRIFSHNSRCQETKVGPYKEMDLVNLTTRIRRYGMRGALTMV